MSSFEQVGSVEAAVVREKKIAVSLCVNILSDIRCNIFTSNRAPGNETHSYRNNIGVLKRFDVMWLLLIETNSYQGEKSTTTNKMLIIILVGYWHYMLSSDLQLLIIIIIIVSPRINLSKAIIKRPVANPNMFVEAISVAVKTCKI